VYRQYTGRVFFSHGLQESSIEEDLSQRKDFAMFNNLMLRQKRVVVSLLSIVLLGGAVLTAAGLTVLGHRPNKAHAASTISVALNRYYNDNSNDPENQTHATTTGAAPSNFYYEGTIAHLFLNNSAGRVALYSCVETSPTTIMTDDGDGDGLDQQTSTTHSDYFVSSDSNCEGHGASQLLGYDLPQAGTSEMIALYRCWRTVSTGLDHFVSTSPACEGATVDGLLGYTFPAAIVADCGGISGLTQSDVSALVSQAQQSGIYTAAQISQLQADPCQITTQQTSGFRENAADTWTVLNDGHVCKTFTWQFDHIVFGSPDALFTVKQDLCVDPLHQFLDDGTTPPPAAGMDTAAYINTAHKPHNPTVSYGSHSTPALTFQLLMLSYKLAGPGNTGVLYADWQPYVNGSTGVNSPRGAWKTQVGYSAGVLGAGGAGLFGAFSEDYGPYPPLYTIDQFPTACQVRGTCGSGV
jgi:hypothetical protein